MNRNKLIVYNSLILYVRLGIVSICGLMTTRFALKALGVHDFGLFSLVGGIISFVSIINTIMLSASNRFLAVSIATQIRNEINKVFNVTLVIHVFIALITALLAIPIGHWYINNFVHYNGNLVNVLNVYDISIIGAVVSFVGVPYNGLLLAKEKFLVFCSTDVLSSIIRVVCSYLLIYTFNDKLLVYAFVVSFTSAYPTLIFYLYCKRCLSDCISFRIVKDISLYKEITSFSVWVGLGAIVTIFKSQGTALILNTFFNTILNAALGIANTVNSVLLTFSNNVHNSLYPQIVKSYSSDDLERSLRLVIVSSKTTYFLMLSISLPFLLFPNAIFSMWLSEVPKYVIDFTILLIVDGLVTSLNAGVPDLVMATGRIKTYQLWLNILVFLSVVVGYVVLWLGAPPQALFISYILFSVVVFFVRQIVLIKIVKINVSQLIVKSYIPCIIVTVIALMVLLLRPFLNTLMFVVLFALIYLSLIIYVGLDKKERYYLFKTIQHELFERFFKKTDRVL